MQQRFGAAGVGTAVTTLAVLALALVLETGHASAHTDNGNFVFPTDDVPANRVNIGERSSFVSDRSDGQRQAASVTLRSTAAPGNCSWANQSVWYPASKKCEELFKRGSCGGENEWLVLGAGAVPQCQEQPCDDGEVQYQGSCVKIKAMTPPCPLGMEIVATESGQGDCDCMDGHAFWRPKGRTAAGASAMGECYKAYLRGPCPAHQMLVLPSGETEVKCRRNRCKDGEVDVTVKDGQLQVAWLGLLYGKCRSLNAEGPPCEVGKRLLVDPKTLRIVCGVMVLSNRVLINAPLIECSAGSRRDALGRCRRSL